MTQTQSEPMDNPEITQEKPSGLLNLGHGGTWHASSDGTSYWEMRPAPGCSFSDPMQPTRIALALLGAHGWHLTHRMQPDVLDERLMDFLWAESIAQFGVEDEVAANGFIYINGKLWTPPAPSPGLDDWTVRAARITLAMYRINR